MSKLSYEDKINKYNERNACSMRTFAKKYNSTLFFIKFFNSTKE